MSDAMLRVENLTKHFKVKGSKQKVVHAVDGVSFQIPKGKTLGLVGESGCGKSSCARTIIRIYEPTKGKIFIQDTDISTMSQKELKPIRKNIQMIFQDPYASLNARMTVRDIIAEPLNAHNIGEGHRERDDMVFDILEKVGLSKEHASRYAHEFSGGQRQRVGIARALIIQPQIVICDEPISALDVSIQAQVINLLKKFQQEQKLTYLFIAHDLSMVRYVSDEVGVMYLGKLVEYCDSDGIYTSPLHPYTKGLIGSIPIPSPEKARAKKESTLQGDLPSPIDVPRGCRFHTRCKFVKPICKEEEPKFQEIQGGHFVACHLYL